MLPGQTRRYGVSGTLLAAETGRLIIPVAHNAGDFWPRRGLMKKPGMIRVVIGRPMAAAGRDVREINREVQEWIEATVAGLQADRGGGWGEEADAAAGLIERGRARGGKGQ